MWKRNRHAKNMFNVETDKIFPAALLTRSSSWVKMYRQCFCLKTLSIIYAYIKTFQCKESFSQYVNNNNDNPQLVKCRKIDLDKKFIAEFQAYSLVACRFSTVIIVLMSLILEEAEVVYLG